MFIFFWLEPKENEPKEKFKAKGATRVIYGLLYVD